MSKSDEQAIEEFEDLVNMKPKELEDWLGTRESRSVGQGEGESKGHAEGRKIVEIQNKKRSDYTSDDVDHMRKVASYVKRHLGQPPRSENIEESRWRYSLMNWGHDPLK